MRKLFLGTLMLALGTGLMCAQRTAVSRTVGNVDNLIISSKKNSTTIIVEQKGKEDAFVYQASTGNVPVGGNGWNFECPFVRDLSDSDGECCNKYFTGLKDIYWGWNFNYDKKGGLKNCFEVGVGEVIGLSFSPWKQGPSIDIGLGFGMRRYLVQDGLRFDCVENRLEINSSTNLNVKQSRLDSWSFHLPVMFTQTIYKKLAVSAGAWINFNTYVKGNTQYYKDEIRYKEHYKGFNQRFCTVDVVAVVGLRNGIGFYGRLSPMSLFSEDRGPEFRSVSMGVMLNF